MRAASAAQNTHSSAQRSAVARRKKCKGMRMVRAALHVVQAVAQQRRARARTKQGGSESARQRRASGRMVMRAVYAQSAAPAQCWRQCTRHAHGVQCTRVRSKCAGACKSAQTQKWRACAQKGTAAARAAARSSACALRSAAPRSARVRARQRSKKRARAYARSGAGNGACMRTLAQKARAKAA